MYAGYLLSLINEVCAILDIDGLNAQKGLGRVILIVFSLIKSAITLEDTMHVTFSDFL